MSIAWPIEGLTTEQLVRAEGQAQAADQVSIGNSINSLRFLNSNDWRQFVGEHSLVEQTLAGDPAGLYAEMDFATRDRYRHAVEGIARRSHLTEYDVARKAVQLAESHAREKPDDRAAHVGYYLVDRGRPVLERVAEMRLSRAVVLDKLRRRFPLTVLPFRHWAGHARGDADFFALVPQQLDTGWPALLHAGCAGADLRFELGTGTRQLAGDAIAQSRNRCRGWILSKEFRQSIARWWRCPRCSRAPPASNMCWTGWKCGISPIATRACTLRLLTDFVDAAAETLPGDAELVRLAREGIERLNEKYAAFAATSFISFIARAAGMPRKAFGWATSASAASWPI